MIKPLFLTIHWPSRGDRPQIGSCVLQNGVLDFPIRPHTNYPSTGDGDRDRCPLLSRLRTARPGVWAPLPLPLIYEHYPARAQA